MIFLDLGSNLDREASVTKALQALQREFGVLRHSSVWESPPYPPGSAQPNFYNLAVQIDTRLAPDELRRRLREIEAQLGRVRSQDKFAARTVDLDLTLYPGMEPHPQVATQPFVLVPLCELEPDLVHSTLERPLRDLLAGMPHGPDVIWRAPFQPGTECGPG